MKQHVSALMDGELFDEEAEAVFDKLKRGAAGQEEWRLYHLIGDSLRQPDHVHADVSVAVGERLATEPTVLAPRSRAAHRARWFAVSAAASVMALTVLTWLSARVAPPAAPQPQVAAVSVPSGNVRPASLQARRNVNDYLLAHQDYAPSNSVQVSASAMYGVAGK